MAENKTKPAIRFAGFADAWEQRKLGECFAEHTESMPDGEMLSVTISSGIKKFSELGRHDNSNDDKSKYKKVSIGDIAYNSMRMWQGASGYSPYEGIVSPAYTVLSPVHGTVDSKCISYLFKRDDIIHKFQLNSQGITSDNWNLKYPALSQIEIMVSKEIDEQQKIATYFSNLDNLITLHQRKYDKLVTIKKSCLEKMFVKNSNNVPEIRFKGFTDAWEQRKLGDLSNIIDPHPSHRAPAEEENGIPFIGIGDIDINGNIDYDKARKVSRTIYDEHHKRYDLAIPSLGIGRVASLGKVIKLHNDKGKYTVSPTMSIMQFNEDNNIDFLFATMNTEVFQRQFASQSNGSTRQSVGIQDLRTIKVSITNDSQEQQKIGHYFENLDNLITLHQRKLEKLKNIKKACLESMFI